MQFFNKNIEEKLFKYALCLTNGDIDFAKDTIQRLWVDRMLPLSLRDGKELIETNYNLTFLKKNLYWAFLDERNSCTGNSMLKKPKIEKSEKLEDNVEIYKNVVYLTEEEQSYIKLKHIDHKDLREIALLKGLNYPNIRQIFSRITKKLKDFTVVSWIKNQNFQEFNVYSISTNDANRITKILLSENIYPNDIISILKTIEAKYNKAIQNLTWILLEFGINGYETKSIISFFETQIIHGQYYRGNINYISDALLELKGVCKTYDYFLDNIENYKSRIKSSDTQNTKGIIQTDRPTLLDVKPLKYVETADKEIVRRLERLYLNEQDVDLHRTLAFQLLKLRPQDAFAKRVINELSNEYDQDNAFYIAKFIKLYGITQYMNLVNNHTLEKVKRLNKKWPQNRYFRDLKNYLKSRI